MKYLFPLFCIILIFSVSSCENISLEDKVIKELGLDRTGIKNELITTRIFPNNPSETILVIPEIESEEEGCCFDLNSHIVIIDSNTGKIKNKYFESAETNKWSSDIVALSKISIDSIAYPVSESKMALGIRVYHSGMSKTNPMQSTSLSLFVKSERGLKKILKNYEVMEYTGEWDAVCTGIFTKKQKQLNLVKKQSNGFYNIAVIKTNTQITKKIDSTGECGTKEGFTSTNTILKFNGSSYKNSVL